MTPTGTHFNYYQVCKRKLWLFANGINMEHYLRGRSKACEDCGIIVIGEYSELYPRCRCST